MKIITPILSGLLFLNTFTTLCVEEKKENKSIIEKSFVVLKYVTPVTLIIAFSYILYNDFRDENYGGNWIQTKYINDRFALQNKYLNDSIENQTNYINIRMADQNKYIWETTNFLYRSLFISGALGVLNSLILAVIKYYH